MGCQGIPLVTRGMIFCPDEVVSGCVRYVLPFNLKLLHDKIELSVFIKERITLASKFQTNKIFLTTLSNFKLTNKILSPLKLELKKCED
jgi:hypothetical protein